MINAKEAKEATDKVNKEFVQSELDTIESDIESCIDDGEYEMIYTKTFEKATIDALRTLEYKVDVNDDQRDGYTLKITW